MNEGCEPHGLLGHVPMHLIEENRVAHTPRVFRAMPLSVGLRAGNVVSDGADQCTRERVRSPFHTLRPLTTEIASGYVLAPHRGSVRQAGPTSPVPSARL